MIKSDAVAVYETSTWESMIIYDYAVKSFDKTADFLRSIYS